MGWGCGSRGWGGGGGRGRWEEAPAVAGSRGSRDTRGATAGAITATGTAAAGRAPAARPPTVMPARQSLRAPADASSEAQVAVLSARLGRSCPKGLRWFRAARFVMAALQAACIHLTESSPAAFLGDRKENHAAESWAVCTKPCQLLAKHPALQLPHLPQKTPPGSAPAPSCSVGQAPGGGVVDKGHRRSVHPHVQRHLLLKQRDLAASVGQARHAPAVTAAFGTGTSIETPGLLGDNQFSIRSDRTLIHVVFTATVRLSILYVYLMQVYKVNNYEVLLQLGQNVELSSQD